MYIKAWRNKKFHWKRKAALWPGEGRSLFRRVSRCVRFFEQSRAVLPAFARGSKRRPFVSEVEKHDARWSEIELLLIVRVHREPGNVCI